jgi:hypothetical protein
MAYPTPPATAIPDVATDANYDAAGEDWHGTPTKVTTSVAVQAQGFVPGDLRLPMFDNFLFYWIKAWILYLVAYVAELADRLDPATPTTRTIMIPASAFVDGTGTWVSSSFGEVLTATSNSATRNCDLGSYLPNGAIVTRAKALVDPGTGNTMTFSMSSRAYVMDVGSESVASHILIFGYASSGVALQSVDTGAFTETIARATKVYTLEMAAGSGAAANNDAFYGAVVTFLDPGPRER